MCDALDHGPVVMTRAWVGRGRFPGLGPITYGTVYADDAPTALERLRASWVKHLPCEPPADLTAQPGALAFMEPPPKHVGKRDG
jgi:hypothetical protein